MEAEEVQRLMDKADQAVKSARLLLNAGDADGACNRAYYAMFDASRAALIASKAPVTPEVAKSHAGLIAAVSLHLVKNGPLPREVGRLLNRAQEIRLVADYRGDVVEPDDARELVGQAERFIQAIRTQFVSARDG
jgi:uncharacterized protein (UPF0332 family)